MYSFDPEDGFRALAWITVLGFAIFGFTQCAQAEERRLLSLSYNHIPLADCVSAFENEENAVAAANGFQLSNFRVHVDEPKIYIAEYDTFFEQVGFYGVVQNYCQEGLSVRMLFGYPTIELKL